MYAQGWPDAAIGAHAARQRTLITHEQLVALNVGPRAIAHALRRGRLHRHHRGVYSLVAPSALPPLARELAAVLACGPDAFLSHHSAAAVWGFRPQHHGPLHVTLVGRDAGRRRPGIQVHRAARLQKLDQRKYQGIPITSPARTLLDIAADLDDRQLEKAFDEAFAAGLVTFRGIGAVLQAYPRRPGSAALSALCDADRTPTKTRVEYEDMLLSLIRKANLPKPEVNVPWGRWELDFLWRREALVVELDGYKFHSSRLALERNHRKDAELQRAGYLVLRISVRRLQTQPEAVLAEIAMTLARRAAA